MKFGLQVIHAWSKSPGQVENVSQYLVDLAVEAEEAGWEGFFLWDHLWFDWQPIPMADPWTVLAAASVKD
jgi:alkanesulfonate monooxygenase SsuD/methylene tetrahydromethanopterin reductase-like flavin-dependent oxidoreductase (luciferase family)